MTLNDQNYVSITFETEHKQKLIAKANYHVENPCEVSLEIIFLKLNPNGNFYPFDHLTSRDQELVTDFLREKAESEAFGHFAGETDDAMDMAKEKRIEEALEETYE